MAELTVSFLYFGGCPLAKSAKSNLDAAIRQLKPGAQIRLVKVDLMDPRTHNSMKLWGSPTILIDGEDFAGDAKGSGSNCRIYSGEGRVPTEAELAEAISARLSR
jgi:hypothetical protein